MPLKGNDIDRIKRITEDYVVGENDRPARDVFDAVLYRAQRGPLIVRRRPKNRFTNPEVILRAANRVRQRRKERIKNGLCPECGKVPEDGRLCNRCKSLGASRNRRSRA